MPTLHWLTRETDLKTAANTPYRLLVEEENYGYGDPDSDNFIVQGDNLDALKALLPFYAGQVKCIYIDPPYNTGSAFDGAIARRAALEKDAQKEREYICPILLFQAQSKDKPITVEVLKNYLLETANITENQIRIATGEQKQLDDIPAKLV